MKFIKTVSALAFAVALMASTVLAQDEHKQAGCCKKAATEAKEGESKACAHKCCVAAAKEGNECEKCGGKGKIPKAEKKEKEAAKS